MITIYLNNIQFEHITTSQHIQIFDIYKHTYFYRIHMTSLQNIECSPTPCDGDDET